MRFISPERLYWLAALLIPAAAAAYAGWRRRRELRRLFADRETAAAALRLSHAGRGVRIALVFVAMAAIVVAAARPYWKTRRVTFSGRGRDVAVVFDVSKSMWAGDLPPSRLAHAKFTLRQLAGRLRGDRLSLIAFAGNAYLACPLTPDRAVFDEYVDELGPDLVQRGGTDLEKGLREALDSLDGAAGTQAIVVFTDGDELSGDSSRVISELERRKIPLIVIGLGDPKHPAVLPDENGSPRRDKSGKIITVGLNETALKRLAAETRGTYIRSTVSDTGAETAAKRIGELAPALHGETEKELPEERFDVFLVFAAAALLLALTTPERPWRSAALLAAALLACGANAAEKPEAATPEKPRELDTAAPRKAAELYNLGLELHKSGDLAEAGKCFEAVLRHPDRDERARAKALSNLGAMEHSGARQTIGEAREQLKAQQIDQALGKLDGAAKSFDAAGELYKQALAGPGADALDKTAANNLRLLEKDRKELRDLKKAIEELKKQLDKARQSARNAQQQNRQDQQPQQKQQDKKNQQQSQSGQDKKNQPQSQSGQDKKDQQQSQNGQDKKNQPQSQNGQDKKDQRQQQSPAQAAAGQAAEESAKLRDRAEKLGQRKLEEQARQAAEELRQAERAPDAQSARPHLDRAVSALHDRGGEPPPEKKDGQKVNVRKNRPEPEAKTGPDGVTGHERLLRIMNEEELRQRRNMRGRNYRQPDRDW